MLSTWPAKAASSGELVELSAVAALVAATSDDPTLVIIVGIVTTLYGFTLGGLFMAGKIHTHGELEAERADKKAWKARAEAAEALFATFYRDVGERHLSALLETTGVIRAQTAVSERVVDALTHRGRS